MHILNYRIRISLFFAKPLLPIRMICQTKGITTNTTKEPKMLFEKVGTTGIIKYNQPKLNLVVYSMIAKLFPILQAWSKTQSRVIMKGAGGNLSAGTDLNWLLSPDRDTTVKIGLATQANNLYTVHKFKVPYISFLDGISIGGPLMVSIAGRYRVATERVLIALPECRIGWLSDSAILYFMPRMDNHLGYYLALTGKRLKGKDVVSSGLATHFVPSDRLRDLEAELCRCNVEDIEACLDAFSESPGEFSLAPNIKDINYCFSAGTVEEVIERLRKVDNSWSKETLDMMAPLCPTMLKVGLRLMKIGKDLELDQCLRIERRVLSRVIGSYNAQEGKRTMLVDKTDSPNWCPRTLAEVTDAIVDSYFEPLPEGEELVLYDK